MGIDRNTGIIEVVFSASSGTLTPSIEVGRWASGVIWCPVGFQTGNLTFELAPHADMAFHPLSGFSVAGAAASNVYSITTAIAVANAMKIRASVAPVVNCYLILKG